MKLVKINDAVSMYEKPVFGTVKAENRVMAISIDKETKNPYLGLAREITKSNNNNPNAPGNIDESKLIIVESKDLLSWKKVKDLEISGMSKILGKLAGDDKYFIGLEDPDIFNEDGIKHVYFTIAFKYKEKKGFEVYLGHAQGESIGTLKATEPVLSPTKNFRGFKEVTVAPVNRKGERMNLTEAQLVIKDDDLSVIIQAKAKIMGGFWEYQEVVVDPRKMRNNWCNGEASPMVLFSRDFISLKNKDLVLGIINGREPKKIVDGKKVYGKFRPGLIIYNIESGKVEWIAKECLFEDPDGIITFSSDFIQTKKGEGILYAHVNDSFVRAYKINAKGLKKLVPKKFL